METENNGKNEIQDADVLEKKRMTEPALDGVRKRRKDFYIELTLILILGVLMGVALKKEALKKITMGYDDYKMKIYAQDYDLNALETQAIQKAKDAQAAANAQNPSQNAQDASELNDFSGDSGQE